MVDAGVTMFTALTPEEADRLAKMPGIRRLEQELYYDKHPLEWTMPQGTDLAPNGVEDSTAAAMAPAARAALREKESEIKKLKADLAKALKTEKAEAGKMASIAVKAS